jgi:hypothetical protein
MPKVVIECLPRLLHILQLLVSNLGPKVAYPD